MDYLVVHPANADLLMVDESWPVPARPIRAAFLASEDGKIVLTVTGNGGWKDKMWPKIQELTGTKA